MPRFSISINDLRVKSLIGIYPNEREAPQDLLISVDLIADLINAAYNDQITDTLDYDTLMTQITDICYRSSYQLLESLALAIHTELSALKPVHACQVKIEKPNISPNARSVSVSISTI